MFEDDAALENVGVVACVGLRRVGLRQGQQLAEFGNEKLVVGAFGTARRLPAGNEGVDGIFAGVIEALRALICVGAGARREERRCADWAG